jgi:hypothetical protein
MKLVLVLALLALSPAAAADDWYVDAVHGNDTNAGIAPAQAWRTLTHALATVPIPITGRTQTIHVAPGTYGAANGEAFPLLPQDAFRIVGDAGPAVTIVDGGGGTDTIFQAAISHPGGNYTGPLSSIEGLTLRDAAIGVSLASSELHLYMTCRDVRIENMSTAGVRSVSTGSSSVGWVRATLERVAISGCGLGVDFSNDATGPYQPASMDLADCDVSSNVTSGIRLYDHGSGTSLTCVRTRIVDNGADGVSATHQNPLSVVFTSVALFDCLIARNGGSGILATVPGSWIIQTVVSVDLQRCTIARNAGSGLDAFFPSVSSTHFVTTLRSSILYGNSDDLRENSANPSIAVATFNDIGDGDFSGTNGNIAADPAFRDPFTGDWRLIWGSPCVDAGDPATPPATLDLRLVKRPVDGDLDVMERADIGAYEFTPLDFVAPPHVGGFLTLEQWGPSGGRANLYLARGQPMATPLVTTFGDFDLDPNAFRNLGSSRVAPYPPALRILPIANNAQLVGQTFSLQALETSTVVSPTAAYTNPITFTILP